MGQARLFGGLFRDRYAASVVAEVGVGRAAPAGNVSGAARPTPTSATRLLRSLRFASECLETPNGSFAGIDGSADDENRVVAANGP